MNYLREGIWEFKVSNLRLTFYDTDGFGSSCTTDVGENSERLWDGTMSYSLPEDFGELIRLGHHFPKAPNTRKTPPGDLTTATTVRKEDFEHDAGD